MLLVDLSIIIHRSFHALDFLATTEGVPSGMEYGTLRSLRSLEKQYGDMILCLDHGKEKKHAFYKANRPKKPASFYKRLERITDICKQMFKFSVLPNTEADTIMHGLSLIHNGLVCIFTNDKDLHQSISSTICQIKSHNSKHFVWGPEELWEKYKIRPNQWALYRALTGDPSDNIPKCKGFGPIYAAELVRASYHEKAKNPCDRLISIIEGANLSKRQRESWNKFRDQLRVNYELISIPIIKPPIYAALGGDISGFLEEFEIKTITLDETEF